MDNSKITDNEIVINIAEIINVLKRKLWVILLTAAIFAGLVITYKYLDNRNVTLMYQSTTKLYVPGMDEASVSAGGINLGRQVIFNYIELLKSRPVLERVINEIGLNMGYYDLLSCLSINSPENTCMLEIMISFPEPNIAKTIADKIVNISSNFANEVMGSPKPYIYEEGNVPLNPYNNYGVGYLKYALVACLAGVLFSAFCILISHFNDKALYTPERVKEYIKLNTIAMIPKKKKYLLSNKKKKH